MVLQLSLACHQMKHFCFELCSVQLWFIQYLDPLDYVNFGLIWYMTVLTTSNYTCTSYIYLWLISVKLFAFQTNVININAPVPRCSGSSYSWSNLLNCSWQSVASSIQYCPWLLIYMYINHLAMTYSAASLNTGYATEYTLYKLICSQWVWFMHVGVKSINNNNLHVGIHINSEMSRIEC